MWNRKMQENVWKEFLCVKPGVSCLPMKLNCCMQVVSHQGFHENCSLELQAWNYHWMGDHQRCLLRIVEMSDACWQVTTQFKWAGAYSKQISSLTMFQNCLGVIDGKHVILQASLFITIRNFLLFAHGHSFYWLPFCYSVHWGLWLHKWWWNT